MQPKPFHPGKTAFVAVILLGAFFYTYFMRSPPAPEHPSWQGSTMGTTYTMRIARSPLSHEELQALRSNIDALLETLENQMSTYREEAEISRFNRHASLDPFPVSPLFAGITARALALSLDTGGAFDPTVAPLVQAWGFGPPAQQAEPPTEGELGRLRQSVGYRLLSVDGQGRLVKQAPGLQLDLSAVAKGGGVDEVARILKEAGCLDFFVEIGGEVKTRGRNPDGIPWRIGIETPVADSFQGQHLYGVAHLSGQALATSGDYRNYRTLPDGSLGAHILDPRSGRPVNRALASATVLAGDCATADAAATALIVMGVEEGLAWIDNREGLEALFVTREPDGTLAHHPSRGFLAATAFKVLAETEQQE